jgi:hypothetical protein
VTRERGVWRATPSKPKLWRQAGAATDRLQTLSGEAIEWFSTTTICALNGWILEIRILGDLPLVE